MDIEKAKTFLGQDWIDFEIVFKSELNSEIPLLNKVNKYLFSRSGKQIRPLLTLLAARAASVSAASKEGSCTRSSILCAAAAEILHTATLLHDDVADNSDTRRGAPTIMSIISPTASVLVGDFWLSRAIRSVIDNCDKRVFKAFAKCLENLAEGEMLQIQMADTMETMEDDYIKIISCKTASLFRASVLNGAYTVGADEAVIEALDTYAYHIGLAFQIRDDMFDYLPAVDAGKPSGIDIMEKKITLPLLGAFKNADIKDVDTIKMLMGEIGRGRIKESRIVLDILKFATEHGGLDYSQARIESESEKAVAALSPLPQSKPKKFLTELAISLTSRMS